MRRLGAVLRPASSCHRPRYLLAGGRLREVLIQAALQRARVHVNVLQYLGRQVFEDLLLGAPQNEGQDLRRTDTAHQRLQPTQRPGLLPRAREYGLQAQGSELHAE